METFLLILRNGDIKFSEYSPEDFQKIVAEFDSWNAQMIKEDGLIVSGNLDGKFGKVLGSGGSLVKDGPFSEGKEAIAGFFIIQAAQEKTAQQFAAGCPFLSRGGSVELRRIPELEFEKVAASVMKRPKKEAAQ